AKLGRGRRQVDDDAALAAMFGRHPLHRLARAQDVAGDIDRHHALDALDAHFVDAHAAFADDAAIVDEGAERAELVAGFEHLEYLALVGDIALDGAGLAIGALDDGDHFVCSSVVAGIADNDPKTALGRCNGGGAADAAAAAGDDGYLVSHFVLPV